MSHGRSALLELRDPTGTRESPASPAPPDPIGRGTAHALHRLLDKWIANGRDHEEYEEVFRVLFRSCVFGYELVGDLPWTEIDFPEDITKAEHMVWPQIEALEASLWEPR